MCRLKSNEESKTSKFSKHLKKERVVKKKKICSERNNHPTHNDLAVCQDLRFKNALPPMVSSSKSHVAIDSYGG